MCMNVDALFRVDYVHKESFKLHVAHLRFQMTCLHARGVQVHNLNSCSGNDPYGCIACRWQSVLEAAPESQMMPANVLTYAAKIALHPRLALWFVWVGGCMRVSLCRCGHVCAWAGLGCRSGCVYEAVAVCVSWVGLS